MLCATLTRLLLQSNCMLCATLMRSLRAKRLFAARAELALRPSVRAVPNSPIRNPGAAQAKPGEFTCQSPLAVCLPMPSHAWRSPGQMPSHAAASCMLPHAQRTARSLPAKPLGLEQCSLARQAVDGAAKEGVIAAVGVRIVCCCS